MKKLIFSLLLLCAFALPAQAAGITKYPALNEASFWQKNFPAGEDMLLDEEQIQAFNGQIIAKSPTVYDLSKYPQSVSGQQLKEWVDDYDWLFDEDLYVKGKALSAAYKQLIIAQLNIDAIPQNSQVEYAVTICRVNLRGLPTNEGWFYSASDTNFDQLQLTALDPAEPVVVLHKSASGNFAFVQMRNYRGWLPVWTLGFADKKAWLEYADPSQFLTIVADKVKLKTDGKENLFQMGARIPVRDMTDKGYTVLFPGRDKDGKLVEITAALNDDDDKYILGSLVYTRHNIIAQAFKFLDAPYGWGGLQDSVDCSALIERVYRTVGVNLPRDADEQEETAGVQFVLEGLPNEAREAMFSGVLPGDVLFMPGHTLLYLGRNQGVHYAIHSLGSHYESGQRVRIMQVVVSDLSLRTSSGKQYFEVLTGVLSYR